MEWTKEKARVFLEDCIKNGQLPIYDLVVRREINCDGTILKEHTFRHLLCIVYDLKKIEDEQR